MAADLSDEQAAALAGVEGWLASRAGGWRLLTGAAGTGKTYVASKLAERRRTAFCAMTGKAAGVLRACGVQSATTLHKLIYAPDEVRDPATGRWVTRFYPREGALDGIDLVVLDECSMASAQVATDLLSYGVPVLVLGDPAQLPPVGGPGYFDGRAADWTLLEVRRQALESGIHRLALDIREGRGIGSPSLYGPECAVISADEAAASEADLVRWAARPSAVTIVGTHRMRHHFNSEFRRARRFTSPLPQAGDELLCLQNDHRRGLLNGEKWTCVADAVDAGDDCVVITVESDGQVLMLECWRHEFDGEERARELDEKPFRVRVQRARFTYGYAITCHKAQGSTFQDVLVWDESYCFREHADKWLYTAVSRAAKQLVLVRRD